MACYNKLVAEFLAENDVDSLAHEIEKGADGFATSAKQWDVWKKEIQVLQSVLTRDFNNSRIIFEYTIPRIHIRLDVVLLHRGHVFILEFKGHEARSKRNNGVTNKNKQQVERYARYLKACHSLCHECTMFPILVGINSNITEIATACDEFHVYEVSTADQKTLVDVVNKLLAMEDDGKTCTKIDYNNWMSSWIHGAYSPSPNIIETTVNRFRNHKVEEIRSSGASANNLSKTVTYINSEIKKVRRSGGHTIFFVTGVPGAGKTLIGLDVVATNLEYEAKAKSKKRHGATFLSGNRPLVDVLSTALRKDAELMGRSGQGAIANDYKTMVTHVHDFRHDLLAKMEMKNGRVVPKVDGEIARNVEHLVVFDEAQRAFDLKKFTQKGQYQKNDTILQNSEFPFSEPGFMLWVMSQHKDWGVIVCLVGGGQEINTGETGICEWLKWLTNTEYDFNNWKVYVSSSLTNEVYGKDLNVHLKKISKSGNLVRTPNLHLSVPKRSRSEEVDKFVERLLKRQIDKSPQESMSLPELYERIVDNPNENERFAMYRTQSVETAKSWLRKQRDDSGAREHGKRKDRIGFLMSSNAYRLRPLGFPALTQRGFTATADWFLANPDYINSSDFLEIALHEMFVQGLELDWVGLLWDADFRPSSVNHNEWEYYSGISKNTWTKNVDDASRRYQYNAYRVLLTRARKGLIIVVPEGDTTGRDPSRNKEYYKSIYDYLGEAGIREL